MANNHYVGKPHRQNAAREGYKSYSITNAILEQTCRVQTPGNWYPFTKININGHNVLAVPFKSEICFLEYKSFLRIKYNFRMDTYRICGKVEEGGESPGHLKSPKIDRYSGIFWIDILDNDVIRSSDIVPLSFTHPIYIIPLPP